MKPPIIAVENGDVNAFRTVELAERYLEPEDIENNVYEIYDSEGRKVSAVASYYPRRVQLRLSEGTTKCGEELREALIYFLKKGGVSEDWVERAPLRELVARVISDYPTE